MIKEIVISELAEQNALGPHAKALKLCEELSAAGMIVTIKSNSRQTTVIANSPNGEKRIIKQFFDD